MIRVERGAPPALLDSPEFERVAADYHAFHASGGTRMSQTSLGTASSITAISELASGYLQELFRGKCAYTEAAAVDSPHLFHLHRPEADAYDELLGSSSEHYWWLATWFGNWYLASRQVVGLTHTSFPVIGPRSPVRADAVRTEDDLGADGLDLGLLLDPCRDRPEWHLAFLPDGRVEAWADRGAPWLAEEAPRGPTTIRVLDLNSEALVASRRDAINQMAARVDPWQPLPPTLLDDNLPHIGAIRQVLAARWVEASPDDLRGSWAELAYELAPHAAFVPMPRWARDRIVRAIAADPSVNWLDNADLGPLPPESSGAAPPQSQPPMPPPAPAPPAPRSPSHTFMVPRTAAISRVVIKNFQAIEYVDFTIPAAAVPLQIDDPDAPTLSGRSWKVLLGENGTGKSATLRAIGLALASTTLDDLAPDWPGLLRAGATSGRVLLEFTEKTRIDLRFNRTKGWYVGGTPVFDAFVRGFGATRPLGFEQVATHAQRVRIGNLFNPGAPVINAEGWLLEVDDGDFNVAAVAIAEILGRSADVVHDPTAAAGAQPPRFIERTGGELTIGGEPLRHLSDGYQTMIATVCDLMAAAGTGFADMKNASGIVLMDELGTHLHPRWKMQVTSALRRTFPGLQFIVSTHEPLCLLGLVEREVTRVRQSSTRIGDVWHATFEELEQSPSKFRVDRLLTSEFFGLDTTIDPVVERQFREYYDLIRQATLPPDKEKRRKELRAMLSQHGVLGYTARDQLVYEAIDKFLAGQGDLTPEQRGVERKATLEKVVDIWQSVAERRRVGRPT